MKSYSNYMDLKRALKKFRGKSRKNRKNFIIIEEKKSFELSCTEGGTFNFQLKAKILHNISYLPNIFGETTSSS